MSNHGLLRRYVRLPGSVDEAFLMIDPSLPAGDRERCAHPNRLGSTIVISDSAGAVIDTHTYAPFGQAGEGDGGFTFRFTGQKLDPETGLYYYKARYYDPELGRFLQTDPIGYADHMNLYAYVGNDPVNATDPSGLCGSNIKDGVGASCSGIVTFHGDDAGGSGPPAERPQSNRPGILLFPSPDTQSLLLSIDRLRSETRQRGLMQDAISAAAEAEEQGKVIYHHYTTTSALGNIASSQMILYDRDSVLLTPESLSPEEAQRNVFISLDQGLPMPMVRGNGLVIFALDPAFPTRPDPNGIVDGRDTGRVSVPAPLRNGRGAEFLYVGPNFYGASYP